MKKKVISLLLISAMTASMVAGCGDSSSSDTQKGDSKSATTVDDGHTLTVWAWDANFNIPALQAAADDYKENVDKDFVLNIEEQSQSSDIETAITTAGSAGDYSTLPDIVLFQDHYFQQYHTNYPDAWVSANDADIKWDDFSQEKLSFSTIDGEHFGVPVDNGTVIFAYRTDLLEQAGYTVDDMTGISWKDFIEVGKKVYEKTGKYLLAMDGDGNDLFYMMLQAEGISQFKDGTPNFTDNEQLKEIMQVLKDMIDNNVLYLANDWSDYTDQAIQGDMVAGVMNGNWIIPTIEKVADNSGKWEITSLPTLKGGEGYASNGGSSLYITSNCKQTDLAKKFLAYTFGGGSYADKGTSATYDNALKKGGVITTYAPAGKSDVYNEGVEYFNNQPIYSKIVEMGTKVQTVEQSDFHYDARKKLATALINIKGGADIDDELKTAEDDLKFTMGL